MKWNETKWKTRVNYLCYFLVCDIKDIYPQANKSSHSLTINYNTVCTDVVTDFKTHTVFLNDIYNNTDIVCVCWQDGHVHSGFACCRADAQGPISYRHHNKSWITRTLFSSVKRTKSSSHLTAYWTLVLKAWTREVIQPVLCTIMAGVWWESIPNSSQNCFIYLCCIDTVMATCG